MADLLFRKGEYEKATEYYKDLLAKKTGNVADVRY